MRHVRILSESFKPGLLCLGIPEAKMSLVYDWVDTDLIRPLPHANEFSQEYNIADRFVVLYAGNIGLSQGLEHILTAAEMLSDQPEIRFVFVGEGSGRELLQTRASEQQLTNIQFIPFQPRDRLPDVLASADVSLVILRQGIGTASLPSKVFSIMASGRPMIVSVDEESETCKLVKKAQAGITVPPENPDKLVEAILTLKRDKELCHFLGQNGRKWAEQNHSPQNAVVQFEELLQNAVERHRSRM
jgi:colanic acid biosynthesis glycosyl transferase WcaI